MVGAVFTAMSVQWTVARAVGSGLWKEGLPFMRTAKGGTTRSSGLLLRLASRPRFRADASYLRPTCRLTFLAKLEMLAVN